MTQMSGTDKRSGRSGPVVAMIVVAVLVAVSAITVTGAVVLMTIFAAKSVAPALCGATGGVTAAANGPVRLPITGRFAVTSEFGNRFHPTLKIWRLHGGIDLAGSPGGGPVVAAQAGFVSKVESLPGGGNVVTLNHGAGTQTVYKHLSRITTTQGRSVASGEQIGIEGSTGESSGLHVHFETIVNGAPQNPRIWFAKYGVAVPAPKGSGVAPAAGASSGGVVPVGASTSSAQAPQIGAWAPDQVGAAAQIIAEGQSRGLDTWTQTVAVMVSMRESSLRPVPHGDEARNDTVGYFQQGPEHGPLAVRMDARGSAGLFYGYLLKVPGYRDLAPTIAAHRAQRNADPYHYESAWDDAVQVVSRLTDDPSLLQTLSGGGGVGACDPEAVVAGMPGGPGSNCPASGSPAEARLNPVALAGLRCTKASFTGIRTMYGQSDRGGDHATGDAVDFMLENYRTAEGRAYGWQLASWVREHARAMGVSYVIYDMKIWSLSRDGEGWRTYTRYGNTPNDTLAHRDHVHVSY